MVLALAVWYDTHCFHNFNTAEAMDAAQVARHLAEGKGFTTDYVRPFGIFLLQQHAGGPTDLTANTNVANVAKVARLDGNHPDLANAPLYPLLLAGLFAITSPDWAVDKHSTFWSDGSRFVRYKPEFLIALLNQLLLLAAIYLTFIITRTILSLPTAWLVCLLMIASDSLWKISVSGLPTLLLLTLFLGLIWCLVAFHNQCQQENPAPRRLFWLAAGAGLLVGLGLLTRYAFGWVIIPTAVFLVLFGRGRRTMQTVTAVLAFTLVATPWIIRNWLVSGTCFGTAGYDLAQDTLAFPGLRLQQSLTPDMTSVFWLKPYLLKFIVNFRALLDVEVPRLGGSWIGILFLAGLLLNVRTLAARRLRYFTLMCLGIFLMVTAMLQSQVSLRLGAGSENQLVLLTPLVMIFGVEFFVDMLNLMNIPSLQIRSLIIALTATLACLPLGITLLPPQASPSAFPPYYPPDIQRFSKWILPDELLMSDIPWAVAWYGHRPCTLTTLNSRQDFITFNDYLKHVSGLYLTRDTMDARLFSDCLQKDGNWSSFVFDRMLVYKTQEQASATMGQAYFEPLKQDHFPLTYSPTDIVSGLFLTDRQRWKTAAEPEGF